MRPAIALPTTIIIAEVLVTVAFYGLLLRLKPSKGVFWLSGLVFGGIAVLGVMLSMVAMQAEEYAAPAYVIVGAVAFVAFVFGGWWVTDGIMISRTRKMPRSMARASEDRPAPVSIVFRRRPPPFGQRIERACRGATGGHELRPGDRIEQSD